MWNFITRKCNWAINQATLMWPGLLVFKLLYINWSITWTRFSDRLDRTKVKQILVRQVTLSGLGPETRPSIGELGTMQMQLGHKSSNTNVTGVISFQITIPYTWIEASLEYTLVTDRTLGPADTGQASGLVQSWSRNQTFNRYRLDLRSGWSLKCIQEITDKK